MRKLTLATGLALCGSAGLAAPAPPSAEGLLQEIQREIGDAECDGPQQCHTIAIGAKACGGPEAFLAWSSKRSDAKRLQDLADQHRKLREEEHRNSGMLSNCMTPVDPGAVCSAGSDGRKVCKLRDLHINPSPYGGRAD